MDPQDVLPQQYHSFHDVFNKIEAEKLPPNCPQDHEILLKPGAEPPHYVIYPMGQDELHACKDYLEKYLDKGLIQLSQSPAAAIVLFVKKPDGSL